MEEQFENKERTVYLSSTGDFIKTDLTNPREIKYAAEIQLAKKDRDKFFGLKPLEQDRAEITKAAMEDKGRGYLKQAGAGIGSAIVNMGQTVWNWAKYTNANLVNKAWRKLNDYSADILKATGSIDEETRASMMNQVNNNYKSVRDILNEEILLSREKQNAYLEKTGLAKKEGDSLIYDIANGVGSVAAALGVAIVTKSPNAAAVLFGGIAGQSGYEEALAAGIEPEKALKVGSVRGLVEGTLEKIGLHCYIEGLKTRGIITRILKNAAVEATQEMSQQTAEEILQTKYGGRKEDWKRAAEDILLSGFVGMIVGGGFSAAGVGTNMIEQENAAQKDTSKISLPTQKLPTQNIDLTDAFESGVKRFTDLGMPEKDAAELTFSLLKKAAEPETAKEIVDMIREENSNLTYLNNDEDQNAAAVAEAIKQATAPDRVVKQQAFNIADEVEEGALKAGRTPEEAAASASLAQKASMGFYELTGVLPKDQIQIKIEADKEAELNAANENDLTGEEDISFDISTFNQEGIKYDKNGKADINTPEFKAWFGNSKVVDENGKPLALANEGNIYKINGFFNEGFGVYSYKDAHRSPSFDDSSIEERLDYGGDFNLKEILEGHSPAPEDYFSFNGPKMYGYDTKHGLESWKAINNVIQNNKKTITAYRAVPADMLQPDFNNGEWITFSKEYAKMHGENRFDGNYKIIEKKVPIKNVWWDGNDINEWGYDDGKGQKPTLYLKIENPKYQAEIPDNLKDIEKLREQGYDGIITPDGKYFVFTITQIKSKYNKGTFDAKNPNIFYQAQLSDKTKQKAREVRAALQKIANGAEEATVSNLRDDLQQYGGTNDITFIYGNEKKGLFHIASKHGGIKTLLKVLDTVVDGKISKFVKGKKTIHLLKNGAEAVLSLDENGNKKTWLLTGWDNKISPEEERQFSANLNSAQNTPTFSRRDLVAGLNNSITDIDEKVKGQTLYQEPNTPRGSVTFADDIKQAFIKFNNTADKSTLIHELGHIWLKDIEQFSAISQKPEFLEFKENLDKWLGEPVNGVYSVEQQEKFAKTFERYLQEGKAPNAELKTIFEKFKAWLSEIYTAVKDFIQLSPEAVKTFDTLLSTERGKYNLENIRNKTAQAKAVVEKIKKGQAVSIDGITIKDIKEALKVMNSRMPAEPKENLLRVLRRKGADYANAGKIDKEAYKNAYVPNKKDGIQDGLALTLRDWGFMAFDDSAVADYEGLSKQEEIAADLIDRALNGEKIYQVNDPQAAKREQFLADVEKAREIVGENGEEIARAIAALEEKGYRIIEKEDINYLARQLKELDRIVEKSQILESQEEKEKGNKEFEKMKKQTALEARRIKAAVIEELNKRDIAGKSTMFAVLEKAQTPEEIFTAAADILTEISREFEKTEEGQAEQRKIDVPKTDWEAKRVNLLKELAEISANATKEERAARNMIEQARQARHGARAALSKKELAEYEKAKSFLSKSFEKKYLKAFNNALRGEPHIEGKDVASIMRVMANNAMEMRLISDHIVKQFISIAQRKQTANYKKYLSGKISALLNNKIFAKVGQLRRAKFTPEIMEFMKHAKEIWGLTNKDAEKEYDFRAKSYDPENPPSPVQAFENRLLEFKVLWDTQDPADAKGLYDELLDLLRGDRQLKRFEEVKKQFNESGRRLILTQALKEKKLPVGTKAYLLHAGTDLQSALDVLFGKFEYETMGYDGKMHKEIFNAREEFAGELDQIEEQNFLHHYNMALDESVRSAYGLDTKFQMFDKIKELLDYKKEVINYGFIKDTENGAMIASIFRNGKWVDNNNPRKQTLNKLNIIYDYIQSQNHEYVETAEGIKDVGYAARLERSYGKEQLNDMFACLTDQDRKLADSLIELASKFYPELNKVHKRIYGFALPKTEGVYFPGVTERIADDVDWHADFVANSKSPSFIKERVKSNKPVMALVNPLAVLKAHGRRSAEFIYNAERFTELKRMFKAEEMKTAFVEKFGQNDGIELYQKMLRLIDLQGPQKAQAKGEFFKVSDKIFNNWVKTAMGLKIMTGIKQVASGISFAEKMPAATYTKYFAEAMAHPVQTMDFMNKTFPYIETRFETGGINEAVARAMARNDISAMGEKFSMITNLGLLNTRYGDKLSISLFGQPYYRYLREDLKLPEDKAKAEFLRQATTTLQSSLKSQLSEAQSVADNFATRVFMVFRNQQLQYVRKAFTTYAQYKNGELSAKQFAKAEFIYLVLNPLVYVALGIGFIPRDDDDKKRLAAAPITQTLGAYPFGEATAELFVDNVYSMFKDKELTAPQKMGLPMIDDIVKDITRAVKTVNEDDLTAEDYVDATLGIAKYSGLPLNTLKSMIKGGVDITKGKPAKGALEIIGYTETRAGKIVGEEKKKKKKRKRRKK